MSNCSPRQQKLCGKCEICIKRSFASIEKSKFITDCDPKFIFKNSHQIHKFECRDCKHFFQIRIKNISLQNQWCPYCSKPPKRLCGDCETCHNRSIDSIEKLRENWNYELNDNLEPKFIFKGARKKR